ncbi:MAG: DUF814 domain-containing protein [bacterium]|nr:DUF814 domain-containing protein [bacterium]
MKIKIYVNEPLHYTLAKYYDELKQVKAKIEKLKELIKQKEEEVKKLEIEQRENKELLYRLLKAEQRKWYKKFGWSFTARGTLVLIGRDASSNEVLVKKYVQPEHYVFHADIVGAGFVVLRTETPTEEELREAAVLAACFSKAWKACIYSLDVYCVRGHQLSKTAPAGTYLKKGAFMVYGERTYFKNVRLELCLGINFEEPTLFVGSETACKKYCGVYWKLAPGKAGSEQLLQELRQHLQLSKETLLKLLQKYLPGTNLQVLERAEGENQPLPSDD